MIFTVIRTLLSGGSVSFSYVLAQALAVLFVIFCILPFHEFAHGWMAYKLGDSTAKWEGRLTLNPLASIDPVGAFMLMFVGFGWAKPVPVNTRAFKNPKRDMALTALAGPVANLIAAFAGALVLVAIWRFAPSSAIVLFIYNVLWYYVEVNIALAVFNLLPVPPLDGSRILSAFLSDRALSIYMRYQQYFYFGMMLLLITGAFSGPLYTIENFLTNIIFRLASLPFGLFGA